MSKSEDQPLDLYIAAYSDADRAQTDWDAIKQLVHDEKMKVEAMVLVTRKDDGKVHVKDDIHQARGGAKVGAIGGAIVGLIFPPTIIAGAIVGGAIGGGAGGIVSRVQKRKIKADVERTLPPGSSGIVALFEDRYLTDVQLTLGKADRVERHHVDDGKIDEDIATDATGPAASTEATAAPAEEAAPTPAAPVG